MRRSRRKGSAPARTERCPCCYYGTLETRGGYDICDVCGWEDDGQDDDTADEVWGGPNSDLSLTQGRYNFARIGACSWRDLQSERSTQVLDRASGFPFADVKPLSTPPPVRPWPRPWTLSFHPWIRDPNARWRNGVRFLEKNGFRFQGTYETKAANVAEWADPRYLRRIEYDPACRIEESSAIASARVVGAWFTKGSALGARLLFPSVYHFEGDRNEPAITVDAYVSREEANDLFDTALREWPIALGNCSPTSWGLQTVTEMTGDLHATQFVHGRTYLASSLAETDLVAGFRERFGAASVQAAPSGLVFVGAGIAEESPLAQGAYLFLKDRMRRVAFLMMAGGSGPKPS